MKMGVNAEQWDYLKKSVNEQKTKRKWAELPAGWETEAVKRWMENSSFLKGMLKDLIPGRIAAGKATTFDALLDAIALAEAEANRKWDLAQARHAARHAAMKAGN